MQIDIYMNKESGVQSLLAPLNDAQPCGENLEATPLLSGLNAFRVFGETMLREPPPDWDALHDRAAEALARSHDLRALAHYAAASIRGQGLGAFFDILGVAAYWLETFWPGVYPLIDEDAVLRRNALNSFADRLAILDALRRAPLVAHPQLGKVSLRDLEIASGQLPLTEPDAKRPEEAQIAATFSACPIEQLTETLKGIEAASGAVRRIETAMVSNGGVEAAPSLEPLSTFLVRIQRVIRERMASHPQASQINTPGPTSGTDGARPAGTPSLTSIQSRDDAINALDAVSAFFRRTEPSSPIPMFIERAKRLVAKNFLEVLADVAPDGVSQARLVGGVRDGE